MIIRIKIQINKNSGFLRKLLTYTSSFLSIGIDSYHHQPHLPYKNPASDFFTPDRKKTYLLPQCGEQEYYASQFCKMKKLIALYLLLTACQPNSRMYVNHTEDPYSIAYDTLIHPTNSPLNRSGFQRTVSVYPNKTGQITEARRYRRASHPR